MSAGIAARAAALEALLAVTERGMTLDAALETVLTGTSLAGSGLEPRDRGFARLLVTTVLRRHGQIDWVLGQLRDGPQANRASEIGPPRLLAILRLGIAQLLWLGTPAYAAVSATLGLLEGRRETKARGFANALLRQASRQREALMAAPETGDGPAGARLNLPDWLAALLEPTYGRDGAGAIAMAHLVEPPLDITAKADAPALAERLEARLLPTGTLRRSNTGMVPELPGFSDGSWWVQDAAAALPVRLLGDVRGRMVLDLCAAPGGKTAQLAAAGARVIAVDRSKKRLKRLCENLDRLGLAADTVCADACTYQPGHKADAILLDAPCSATGTIRRHPDILLAPGKADISRLIALQDRLLAHAVSLLAPGGMLVWCTCSLFAEEGEARIAKLLASGAPLRRVPVRPGEIGDLTDAITQAGEIRTLPCFWPDLGGLDGFHIARLQRSA